MVIRSLPDSMQTNIPDLVLGNPTLSAALLVTILALVAWQRTLTVREYIYAHTVKTLLFRALDPWASRRGRPLINDKGGRDDAEFVTTFENAPRTVLQILTNGPFDPHLISTDKRRPDGTLDDGHAVMFYDGRQVETYIFANDDGTTDIYVHEETSVTDPEGHLSDPQNDGDTRGVVTATLRS